MNSLLLLAALLGVGHPATAKATAVTPAYAPRPVARHYCAVCGRAATDGTLTLTYKGATYWFDTLTHMEQWARAHAGH